MIDSALSPCRVLLTDSEVLDIRFLRATPHTSSESNSLLSSPTPDTQANDFRAKQPRQQIVQLDLTCPPYTATPAAIKPPVTFTN